ncbi:MAG TPA: type II secretion system protein N [Pseudomonas sp.]|nr:type II secretion system protein N [Pseudomonas sp.]
MKGWLIVGKVLPWLCGVCLGLLPVLYGLGFWHWQAGLESAAAPKIESRAVALEKPFDPSAVVLLFGDPPTQPALVAPIESVKDSGLSLKLIASFVSPQGRSAAVLAGDAREQQLFFIGDQVLPGVELVRVQPRRVLVRRNGVLESIRLVEADSAGLVSSVPTVERAKPMVSASPVSRPLAPVARPDLLEKMNRLKSLAAGGL